MTVNNQYRKLNIAFLVIVAPFPDLARRRDKLSAVLYDPEVGRFINIDGYVSTGTGMLGYNMYAY